MINSEVVRRFETEFKDRSNFDIVDELMTEDFVHNLPYPGLPGGREGMKTVGRMVTGAFKDIEVSVDIVLADGDLVADRITASGTRAEDGEKVEWVENHIYRVRDGRISALWPAGGPTL